jgi:hypothetical protein
MTQALYAHMNNKKKKEWTKAVTWKKKNAVDYYKAAWGIKQKTYFILKQKHGLAEWLK